MFSLKAIQKKIDKLAKERPPRGDTNAGRKRKNGKPEPKSPSTTKQRKNTAIPTTTTTTTTNVNENKPPRRNILTTRNRRAKTTKRQRKPNRSEGEANANPDEQNATSLEASTSAPMLCVERSQMDLNRHITGKYSQTDMDVHTNHDVTGECIGSEMDARTNRHIGKYSQTDMDVHTNRHSTGKYSQSDMDVHTNHDVPGEGIGSDMNAHTNRHSTGKYSQTEMDVHTNHDVPGECIGSETDAHTNRHSTGKYSQTEMDVHTNRHSTGKYSQTEMDVHTNRHSTGKYSQIEMDVHTNHYGECIATTTTASGAVVAALPQGATLYLQGIVGVRPLLGTAEILGYVLQQGQSQAVYSLRTSSLLGVTAHEAQVIDPSLEALSGVDGAWIEELMQKTTSAVLLEFTRHVSPRIDFLLNTGWRMLGDIRDKQTPWQSIKASVVTHENCHKYRVTRILPEWREAVETLVETYRCGSVPCVVVAGGKGVGKSTFFKYLANSLLSVTSDKGVMCLDFDPGQPELSVSTALSLTHLTQPLLAPAYAHELNRVSLSCTHKLIGTVSPQFGLEAYGAAVRELCEVARERGRDVPILVNTMGWTQGTGVGLMLDVVRLAGPTHVVQIQGRKDALNYPFLLEAGTVSASWGGITTQAGGTALHYSLMVLPSDSQPNPSHHISQPKALRELRILAEAGRVVEYGCRVKVPWAGVALHVCEEQVPKDRILQAINAQLVALCRVDPSGVSAPCPDLPRLLRPGSGFGDLLGWAVVMGVDPLTSELHLAASLPPQVVNEQVNAIVLPRIHLPVSFYKVFCREGKGAYLEKDWREGAGRLRVGRRVKPRGPRK